MRTQLLISALCLLAAACGTDDKQVICEKAQSCLGGTDADVRVCELGLTGTASGSLSTCASCLDGHTCSEVNSGACDTACNGVNFRPPSSRQ